MQAAELIERFVRSSKRMKKCSAQAMSKIDLTFGQVEILHYLFENMDRKVTQKDIETEFGLSHATINGFVQRLETKGLLVTRQDDDDKRFKVVKPAEFLYDYYMKARAHVERFTKILDEKMSPNERQTLADLLRKFDNICVDYVNKVVEEEEHEQNN